MDISHRGAGRARSRRGRAGTGGLIVTAIGAGMLIGVSLAVLVSGGHVRPWPERVAAQEVPEAVAGVPERLALLETDLHDVMGRYEDGREIVVDTPDQAYPLILPKLMLSVTALPGGPLMVTLGDTTLFMRIGARRDFRLEGRACFLVLAESLRNRARFFFGCDPAGGHAGGGAERTGGGRADGERTGGTSARRALSAPPGSPEMLPAPPPAGGSDGTAPADPPLPPLTRSL